MPEFQITAAESGRTILEALQSRLKLPSSKIARIIQEGRVTLAGSLCASPSWRVKRGQKLELQSRDLPKHKESKAEPVIRYVDVHVIVVEKPAGLTTVRHPGEAAEFGNRGKRFLPATLADLLPALLAQKVKGKPGSVWAALTPVAAKSLPGLAPWPNAGQLAARALPWPPASVILAQPGPPNRRRSPTGEWCSDGRSARDR